MTYFQLRHLKEKAKEKPFGYYNDVLKRSKKAEQQDVYYLNSEDFNYLKEKYSGKTNFIWKVKIFLKTVQQTMYIYISHRKFLAPKVLAKYRYNICLDCEHRDKSLDKCIVCGCFLKPKTKLIGSQCPLKKW